MMVVTVVLAAIIIPVFSFLAWDYSTCPHVILVPAGSVLSIQPNQHLNYNFTVDKVNWGPDRPIYGTFTADNTVVAYVMTSTQFRSFNSTGAASSYVWSSGQITSANFGCAAKGGCPPNQPGAPLGNYYFVLSNPSTSAVAKVSVSASNPIQLGAC